jgi:hypothetical protein
MSPHLQNPRTEAEDVLHGMPHMVPQSQAYD